MTLHAHTGAVSRLRVLVVDDDDLMLDYVALHLGELNCEVTCADSAALALSLLAKAEYDLLVTDWQMPGLDGMQLIRTVREEHSLESYLHIAMITARDDADAIRQALAAGADDFLHKPLNPVQLELAVASAHRNRTLHRRLRRRAALLATAHRRTRQALDRVRTDVLAAAALHRRLLPAPGRIGLAELAYVYTPALELGGDTLGVLPVSSNALLFFLIDVRGHGVPAALESFHLHHRLKQLSPANPDELKTAVSLLNREVQAQGSDSYATMICGIVLPEREEGWFVRAGHPPLILAGADRRPLLLDDAGCFPLGWFAEADYLPVRFDFPVGGRLICYSDGLTDCVTDEQEMSEFDMIGSLFPPTSTLSIATLAAQLETTLATRMPAQGFADDISLLAIENRHRLETSNAVS